MKTTRFLQTDCESFIFPSLCKTETAVHADGGMIILQHIQRRFPNMAGAEELFHHSIPKAFIPVFFRNTDIRQIYAGMRFIRMMFLSLKKEGQDRLPLHSGTSQENSTSPLVP